MFICKYEKSMMELLSCALSGLHRWTLVIMLQRTMCCRKLSAADSFVTQVKRS
jgi:hypothetical protein